MEKASEGRLTERVATTEFFPMPEQPLRILIIGAHPDDGDIKAGGTAAKWTALGHFVQFLSLTNGQAGHQTMHGPALARRRRGEAQAAAAVIGATYEVLDHPDGELDDRLEYRHEVIRRIRSFRPDVILSHRSTDYHPDHRFAGLLVQDAAYLLTVPAICPDVPHLAFCPVILLYCDAFRKPNPFEAQVVVDIEDQLDRLMAMLHRHVSQFYEWLPYNAGYLDQVPAGDDDRLRWLAERIGRRIQPLADRYRDLVIRTYGPDRGARVRYIEAFEISEYGAPLDAEAWARLFPFLPAGSAALSPFTRKEWVDLPEAE
jgi:LmbE family N-acetylglucosaminyl deacetylase